jgi:hypothetical protein
MAIRTKGIMYLSSYNAISFEIEILKSFVNRIEEDVLEGIKTYKDKIKIIHEEEFKEGDHFYQRIVEDCEGLDNETYDFKSVFEDYLPNLQRRGALITLCSFFEHSLNTLCNDLQKEKKLSVSIIDIKGEGIERAITYLVKVIGIKLDKGTSKEYTELKNILKIRNCFVHREGIIDGNKEIMKYVMTNSYLSGELEIKINLGFLNHVLDSYYKIFKVIFDEVDKIL